MIEQEKGFDATATMGTEGVVYAAEALDGNDLLERAFPAMVSNYVELVKTHLDASGCSSYGWFECLIGQLFFQIVFVF